MTVPGSPSEHAQQVVVVGPDGRPVGTMPMPQGAVPDEDDGRLDVSEMVEQPA
jgi:hypothetical protein